MVVLVTGGASGIGEAISKALLKDGHTVIINYNNSEKEAKKLVSLYSNAFCIKSDVSDEKSVEGMFQYVNNEFGGVDALINNAGISLVGCFQSMNTSDYRKIMDTNFGSAFFCCKYAADNMIKKNKGSIVNISSMWGLHGASCEALYSASKAAVIAFSCALANELAPSGIRVNCVAPGVINTKMNANLTNAELEILQSQTPLNRIGTPEDIASAVKFLIRDDSSFITGQTLLVDGGYLNS